MSSSGHKIFLSYSQKDDKIAKQIINMLHSSGITVYESNYCSSIGESISENIENNIFVSDYMVILLSKNFSQWQEYEILKGLEKYYSKRDITILPIIIDKRNLPDILNSHQYIDISEDLEIGVEKLVEYIINTKKIEFSQLLPSDFEKMVSELLDSLGFFNIRNNVCTNDSEIDIIGDFPYTDPFGDKILETWVVEVKLYKNSRLDIKAIRQITNLLLSNPTFSKGLLVTNGYLTSVANDFLDSVKVQKNLYIRVIEGTELKRLLLKNKDIIDKYFD